MSTEPTSTPPTAPRRRSLLQLLLGSAILLSDEVGERLTIEAANDATHESPSSATSASDPDSLTPAAYVAIGAARSAADQAGRVLQVAADTTSSVAAATGRVTTPILNSPLAAPVRRLRARGEEQLQEWQERGRAESQASRQLAESSITDFVTDQVTDLSGNIEVQRMVREVVMSPEVQAMIEQIIAGQSSSIIGAIIDEIRERFVTLDILLERPMRRLLGRAPREQLPPPPPREAFIRTRQSIFKNRPLGPTLGGYSAGFATRLAASIIDMLLILLTYTISMSFITGSLSLFGLEELVLGWFNQSEFWQAAGAVILGATSLSVIMGYGVLSWYLTGETVGDTIMGVKIIRPDGHKISFARAMLRMIGGLVAAAPLFLGFLAVLWDDQRRGWHDRIGDTYAVYDWPARTDEEFLIRQLLDGDEEALDDADGVGGGTFEP